MAHNLATINGRISMAYQGETPWHNLGSRMEPGADVAAAMQAANLQWLTSLQPVYLDGGPSAIFGGNFAIKLRALNVARKLVAASRPPRARGLKRQAEWRGNPMTQTDRFTASTHQQRTTQAGDGSPRRYYISITNYWYQGSLNAPMDGPLRDEYGDRLSFASREAAAAYLTADARTDRTGYAMGCTCHGGGSYSVAGTFVAPQGCYARPVYRIRLSRVGGARSK